MKRNRISITVDGRKATDEEMEPLIVNYISGYGEADIDVTNPNGSATDGANIGIVVQTELEMEMVNILIRMVDQITDPRNADHTLGAFSLGARIAEAREAIATANGAA